FLAVQHLRVGDARMAGARVDVKGCLLVRVLAVAQRLLALPGARERRREVLGRGAVAREVGGKGPVVRLDSSEGGGGEAFARLETEGALAAGEFGEQFRILLRPGDD